MRSSHRPERFAHAQAFRRAAGDRAIHLAAGLFGGAEASIGQDRFHIFAGVTGKGDFEIVDSGRAVHGEAGGVAAAHEIDQHGREAALDYVAAHAPEDGAGLLPGAAFGGVTSGGERIHHRAEGIAREDAGQRIEPARKARALFVRNSEIRGFDLAAAFGERYGLKPAEIERGLFVFAHAAWTLPSALRNASAV